MGWRNFAVHRGNAANHIVESIIKSSRYLDEGGNRRNAIRYDTEICPSPEGSAKLNTIVDILGSISDQARQIMVQIYKHAGNIMHSLKPPAEIDVHVNAQ